VIGDAAAASLAFPNPDVELCVAIVNAIPAERLDSVGAEPRVDTEKSRG